MGYSKPSHILIEESHEGESTNRNKNNYLYDFELKIGGNNEKRDFLLLRCRDAIENLQEELQDQQSLKHQLQ